MLGAQSGSVVLDNRTVRCATCSTFPNLATAAPPYPGKLQTPPVIGRQLCPTTGCIKCVCSISIQLYSSIKGLIEWPCVNVSPFKTNLKVAIAILHPGVVSWQKVLLPTQQELCFSFVCFLLRQCGVFFCPLF